MHANRTNTALTAIVSRDETQRFSELVSMTETGDILGFTETFESELDRAKALTERAYEHLKRKNQKKRKRKEAGVARRRTKRRA